MSLEGIPSAGELPLIRVLALDGGGARGLTSLLILHELMQRLAALRGLPTTANLRPCDCFDLIIGTGTGGVSALFLGRMRMTVREALKEYIVVMKWLSSSNVTRLSETPQVLPNNSAIHRSFGDITQRFLGDKGACLQNDVTGCHTAILAPDSQHPYGECRIWKSYDSHGDSVIPIASVARATMSYIWTSARLVDIGQNAAQVGLEEAKALWPDSRISCLVSLGTGLHEIGIPAPQNARRWFGTKQTTGTIIDHRVHERISRICSYDGTSYYRFEVDRGLDQANLEEWSNLENLTAITDGYLRWNTVSAQLESCASLLCVNKSDNSCIDTANVLVGAIKEITNNRYTLGPFSRRSSLCLDGQVSNQSKHVVACGGYADIWTGIFEERTVAIKIIRPFSDRGALIEGTKLVKRLWREYRTWSKLSHPNVLDCLGFTYDFTPQSNHKIPSLISQWMSNGTVLSYIRENPTAERLELVVGVARGLKYLHDEDPAIVHGDLRAGNVLVSDTGVACLTDFGLSRIVSETRGMTSSCEIAGSLRWMAPELLHGEKLSVQSDVWAFGMTALEIFTGARPYSNIALEALVLREILDGKCPARPALDSASPVPDEIWSVSQKCWNVRPVERPSMVDVLVGITKCNITK